jgi:FAD/FMN-containing dehydrogenase
MVLADIVRIDRPDAHVETALGILKQRFGERFADGKAMREQHAHTTSYIPAQLPDGVVWPVNEEEVQDVVRICAEHHVPVIPFGVGTSLEGHVNAPAGGVSIDLSRMNKVIAVNAEDLDVVVEPGITRDDLNIYLRDTGLFFPIDPGANATLGGMAATRASGTYAVRYGTKDHHSQARTQDIGRIRPDAITDRLGGHPRYHHVAYTETLRHSTGDRRWGLPVSNSRCCLPGCDCDVSDGHSGGAYRIGERLADEGDDRVCRPQIRSNSLPVS